MKVLYFSQHFSTPKGTIGIRSYEMARCLVKRGHEVTIVCGSYTGAETGLVKPFVNGYRRGEIDGFEVLEFDLAYSNSDNFTKRSIIFVRYALLSLKIALCESYDLLFATTTPLTSGLPGIFARWLRRKPFVFEVRDLWPELPKAMGVISNPVILLLLSLLEWLCYVSAHRLIGLAPGIVDGIIQRGISREKITLIPNGCDLTIFSVNKQIWRPVQVKENDFLAIFTGTHGIANGLDAILNAAAELKRRQCKDIKLLLVGQGKCKFLLQERVRVECLDNVIFLDSVDKALLSELMAGAHLGMQILKNVPAFYYGTSPNKFFDYISAGLPVLNNYPGWIADMITEHQCGYVVPPDNAAALADALQQAAENRESLKKMGQNSLKLAHDQFNRSKLAEQFVNCLEGVVAK